MKRVAEYHVLAFNEQEAIERAMYEFKKHAADIPYAHLHGRFPRRNTPMYRVKITGGKVQEVTFVPKAAA